MSFRNKLLPLLCCIVCSLSTIEAKVFQSSWFCMSVPDTWTFYETVKDNTGFGARYGSGDQLMGVEAYSSWEPVNVPFLRQTLNQADTQQTIKKLILADQEKNFKNITLTAFNAVTIGNDPSFEVLWQGVNRRDKKLLYVSQTFIPSPFMGHYYIVCYTRQWTTSVQQTFSSIKDTFYINYGGDNKTKRMFAKKARR